MNILGHQADPAAPGSLHSGEGRAGRVSGCQGNPPKQTMSKKKKKLNNFFTLRRVFPDCMVYSVLSFHENFTITMY